MWNFFVSENFMNNPFIGWHIESNFSLSIPTNQTWKKKNNTKIYRIPKYVYIFAAKINICRN